MMTDTPVFYLIRARGPDMKKSKFLTSTGALNPLKIHAMMVEGREKADRLVAGMAEDNHGWTFQAVRSFKPAMPAERLSDDH